MNRIGFFMNVFACIGMFFVLASFLICSFLLFTFKIQVGRKKQIYQKLATRYGGAVVKRIFFLPAMRFRYGDIQAYLKSQRKRGGPEQTVLTLDSWQDVRLRFQISTPDHATEAVRGVSDELDARALGFANPMVLRTNSTEELRKMLGQSARWKIEQLIAYLGTGSALIVLKRGKLTITKPGAIRDFQQIDDVLRICLELHDEFLLAISKGVEFIDDQQATVLDDVRCPICSEEVGEQMVICVRCKTPHCKDCWQYNHHCATYACNETRFYEAK